MNCDCEAELSICDARVLPYGFLYRCRRCMTSWYKGWINFHTAIEISECWTCAYNEMYGDDGNSCYCDIHDVERPADECCDDYKWCYAISEEDSF